jgi:multiple sugar transport system permease protein
LSSIFKVILFLLFIAVITPTTIKAKPNIAVTASANAKGEPTIPIPIKKITADVIFEASADELKNETVETENLPAEVDVVKEMTATEGDVLTQGVMQEKDMQKVTANQRMMKILVQIGLYLFLGFMAFIVVFPFYWMIISSLKTLKEYELKEPTFFPTDIQWGNYKNAFKDAHMGDLFMHTVYVGVVSTLLSLVVTILAAFAFARLEFKGRNTFFALLLATMMIPGELFTITNYITVVNVFHWKNTFEALIVPFLVSVFYIYLLKQNFEQIPNELYLAAKVDGTSDLKYLIRVMVPLALPTIISITILKMMGSWNSYMWPKLVANDDAHKLITNGLREMDFSEDGNQGRINYPRQMAAVTMVSIPLFLVFVFLRKYIMKGVSRSGIKG